MTRREIVSALEQPGPLQTAVSLPSTMNFASSHVSDVPSQKTVRLWPGATGVKMQTEGPAPLPPLLPILQPPPQPGQEDGASPALFELPSDLVGFLVGERGDAEDSAAGVGGTVASGSFEP